MVFKTMYKIAFTLSLIVLYVFVYGQKPVAKKMTKRELAIKQIDATLNKSAVLEQLRKFLLEIQRADKDGKAMASSKYSKYCYYLKRCLKYRWFIADTGLSKKWLSDVYKLLEYMQKTRDIIETAKTNGYTKGERYKQALEYFDIAYKRLVKLLKKPAKVSTKSFRRAKLKKVLWQKAMRKKYKIKENISTAEF